MYKNKNILAIIPARGGSKSIPNKNIIKLANKPLIGHTIAQAQKSRYIDKIVVTSDSPVILSVAEDYGAELIHRPKEFAQDASKMDQCIRHALLYLYDLDTYKPDFVVLLQPTSPLRKIATVDKAISEFVDNSDKFDSLTSVHVLEPKLGNILKGRYMPYNKMNMQRQQLKEIYQECGTVFLFKPGRILKEQSLYGTRILPFIIKDRAESIDINDKHDIDLAEYFLSINI